MTPTNPSHSSQHTLGARLSRAHKLVKSIASVYAKFELAFAVSVGVALVALTIWSAAAHADHHAADEAAPLFKVTVAPSAADAPLDGRIIVALSKDEDFQLRNISKSDQLFGITVEGLAPGSAASIPADTLGYPLRSAAEIPPGTYYAKAFLHKYETFKRADGHVLKLPMDRGEGQNWRVAPGNLFSVPTTITVGADGLQGAKLFLTETMPDPGPPAETQWVKNFEMVSPRVSKFWGRDMKIGARVLLPKGYYDEPERTYPVVIQHGHFSKRAPGGFAVPKAGEEGNAVYKSWTSDDFPRFLLITIQHATPYYDDSYAVNSVNHGPYGDAITYELLPAVEKAFRGIGTPDARFLTGGSTGGWEAMAAMVFYPEDYGGTWAFYPDQVDFHYYQLADLYDADNAYYREYEWLKVALPGARDTDGRPRYTMADENHYEEVVGTRYRSGGQWAAWNATFAPVGEDGYPAQIWHPVTGKINRAAAEYAIANYDITKYLSSNWGTVGPKIVDKINVFMGRRDNFFLEQATYRLEDFMKGASEPSYEGRFEYGEKGRHGWNPFRDAGNPALLYEEMMQVFESKKGKDLTN